MEHNSPGLSWQPPTGHRRLDYGSDLYCAVLYHTVIVLYCTVLVLYQGSRKNACILLLFLFLLLLVWPSPFDPSQNQIHSVTCDPSFPVTFDPVTLDTFTAWVLPEAPCASGYWSHPLEQQVRNFLSFFIFHKTSKFRQEVTSTSRTWHHGVHAPPLCASAVKRVLGSSVRLQLCILWCYVASEIQYEGLTLHLDYSIVSATTTSAAEEEQRGGARPQIKDLCFPPPSVFLQSRMKAWQRLEQLSSLSSSEHVLFQRSVSVHCSSFIHSALTHKHTLRHTLTHPSTSLSVSSPVSSCCMCVRP